MWEEVLARFEKRAPASVMAKLALEQAIPAEWVDQVFENQRELLFSNIIELMSLVSLGLWPSLHAAAG